MTKRKTPPVDRTWHSFNVHKGVRVEGSQVVGASVFYEANAWTMGLSRWTLHDGLIEILDKKFAVNAFRMVEMITIFETGKIRTENRIWSACRRALGRRKTPILGIEVRFTPGIPVMEHLPEKLRPSRYERVELL